MKNQFNLNIKTPCKENYNQFKATINGGFCDSCEKEVIDFTKMNANEITKYFSSKSEKDTCGRFKSSQLNVVRTLPKKRKKYSLITAVGLACLSLFSINITQAQDAKKTNKTTGSNKEINVLKAENDITVKGIVLEDGLPLPAVNVILQGTEVGTTTDFDGFFKFPQKLKKGDVLIFRYIGSESQKVIIDNENSESTIELNVNMKTDAVMLMGKIAVKEVYKSKRKK